MKCPHCQESLPFKLCPNCQGEIPEKSAYCCWCGSSVKTEEEGEIDFSERILCSDGNCIGVINERGVCNVCGKAYVREPT
ncbi:MAG: zinc ribbon domain-containing protein [Syntrophaceae bacterium]|nr:zinc ribbon domain-containing protein [Syntrophaceae bacterium]